MAMLSGVGAIDSYYLMFNVSAAETDPKMGIADSEPDGTEEPCGER